MKEENIFLESEIETPEEVKKLQEKGEEIDCYQSGEITVFAKKPTKQIIKMFIEGVKDKSQDFTKMQETFVKFSIVYPSKERLTEIEEDQPAIYISLSNAILERAGLVNFTRRKLALT
ncbi:MAG TPA: hypothetical protein PK771_15885 [Spirochaetota bacterium]|nr:hypothetical protein [Spirochaetota bacterium]